MEQHDQSWQRHASALILLEQFCLSLRRSRIRCANSLTSRVTLFCTPFGRPGDPPRLSPRIQDTGPQQVPALTEELEVRVDTVERTIRRYKNVFTKVHGRDVIASASLPRRPQERGQLVRTTPDMSLDNNGLKGRTQSLSLETVRPLSAVRLGYENAASDLKPRTLSIESLNLESQVRAAIDESAHQRLRRADGGGRCVDPVVVFEDGKRHLGLAGRWRSRSPVLHHLAVADLHQDGP